MEQWYDVAKVQLSEDQEKYSATLLAALTGDAGQRALAAWSLGWKSAQESSNVEWIVPILAQLINDPYHAVRYLSRRSLRAQSGFESTDFDFLAPQSQRNKVFTQVMERWQSRSSQLPGNPACLIDANGRLELDEFKRLLRTRDDRVVVLAE